MRVEREPSQARRSGDLSEARREGGFDAARSDTAGGKFILAYTKVLSRRAALATLLLGSAARPMGRVARAQLGDLTLLSIVDARAGLARRDFSPHELTAAYRSRIAAINPELNAYVTVTGNRVSSLTDSPVAQGNPGPLLGIPIAHKDLFQTAGIRTTAGSRLFEHYVPTHDAAVVARLAAAGAVLLGKTNTHELGGGVTTINPFFGATRNPVDRTRIPGGSSGGSAAAVAARLAAAATGSDTGGSVRIPAALCGCVGLKPTWGWVPTAGLLGACPTFDHAGVLTRTVADAALMLEVMSKRPRKPAVRGRRLRVGVARAFFFDALQPDVATALERVLVTLRAAGADVRDRNLPIDGDTMARVFDPIVAAEIWATYGGDWRARPHLFSPGFAEFFAEPAPSRGAVAAARLALRTFQADVAAVFEQVDVVLTPTVPVTAPPIAGPIDGALILRNTWPFNAARTPAITVPCGTDRAGLPIGAQLAARAGDDWLLLEAAAWLE